jgi:cell division transport system permease protein
VTRRTALVVAAGAVAALAIAGGVLALTREDRRARSDCLVRVFFEKGASPDQIEAVGDRLEAVDDVSVRFVSKKEALENIRRKYPELVAGIPSNPLPDSYSARTRYADSCYELRASLRPRPPGVQSVKTGRPYEPSVK